MVELEIIKSFIVENEGASEELVRRYIQTNFRENPEALLEDLKRQLPYDPATQRFPLPDFRDSYDIPYREFEADYLSQQQKRGKESQEKS